MRRKGALHVPTAREHEMWLTNGVPNAEVTNRVTDPVRQ